MSEISASCHCSHVSFTLVNMPDFINDCNCSLCSKSGALWGYFPPLDVELSGKTQSYTRADTATPAVEIHFCPNCGVTTHWKLTSEYKRTMDNPDTMGVNMRLFDEVDLKGIELRFPDGKNWFGAGEYGYRKDAIVFGS